MRTLASLTNCSRSRARCCSVKSWALTQTPRTRPSASARGAMRACHAWARLSPVAFRWVCMSWRSPVASTRRRCRSSSVCWDLLPMSVGRRPRSRSAGRPSSRAMASFTARSRSRSSKIMVAQGDWVSAALTSGSSWWSGPSKRGATASQVPGPSPPDGLRWASTQTGTARPSRCRSVRVPLHRSCSGPGGRPSARSASRSAAGRPTTSAAEWPSRSRAPSFHSRRVPESSMTARAAASSSDGLTGLIVATPLRTPMVNSASPGPQPSASGAGTDRNERSRALRHPAVGRRPEEKRCRPDR